VLEEEARADNTPHGEGVSAATAVQGAWVPPVTRHMLSGLHLVEENICRQSSQPNTSGELGTVALHTPVASSQVRPLHALLLAHHMQVYGWFLATYR
jgi:hypothetical protein